MKIAHCNTKAGRKRLAVEHISLELLQQDGYFDMPIQVPHSEMTHALLLVSMLGSKATCNAECGAHCTNQALSCKVFCTASKSGVIALNYT